MSEQTQDYLRRTGSTVVITAPTAAENAPAVCYLLSEAATAVTGQVVRVDGGHLSLMAHPAIMEPVLHREAWSVDDVAGAFDEVLGARQSPTGLTWASGPPTAVDPGRVER